MAVTNKTNCGGVVLGRIENRSRQVCSKIIARLAQGEGAEGAICGCPELPPPHTVNGSVQVAVAAPVQRRAILQD